MEINVWTSCTVISATKETQAQRSGRLKSEEVDGTERVFHVNHVVLATGFKGISHLPRNGRTFSKTGSHIGITDVIYN